jgi:hypothetical protein
MRTGYCGSLTTFASWQLELIMLAVTNNKVGADAWRTGWWMQRFGREPGSGQRIRLQR